MKFPDWFGYSMGFDDAEIVTKECRKICDHVPPSPPEVRDGHCLVIVVPGKGGKLIGLAFIGPRIFEAYCGAVLGGVETASLYEASKEFVAKHGKKSNF